ncbi:MAG: hypothetical protein NT062_06260 [Proteobacteria bacterium]|nr:hypothetical protein [Pseudomonadota bacterium]
MRLVAPTGVLLSLVLWMSPTRARAEVVVEPPPDDAGSQLGADPKLLGPAAAPKNGAPRPVLTHKGQVQVSVRAALGLRAIATYDSGVYCGATDKDTSSGYAPVCTSRAPTTLNFELGFGVARKLDVFVELRLGLEEDFGALETSKAGPRLVGLSPGVRYFYSEGQRTKLFSTGQLAFDFTAYKDPGGVDRGNDLGIRNLNGLWMDFAREYGAYVYFGETATFARWFDLGLEVGIGIQGRYP